MDFQVLRREMFRLYGLGEYEAALDLVEGDDAHPDRRGDLYFWRMCLHSRVGRPERTLELFAEALADGQWWAEGMLTDPDLDAARVLPGWAALAEQSRRAAAGQEVVDPVPVVAGPSGDVRTTLVVLHGMDGRPQDTVHDWQPAIGLGCRVAALQATLQFAPGRYAWDVAQGPESAVLQVESLGGQGDPVLAGFSQGAGLAGHLAWTGLVGAAGLILVAPTFRFWGMPIALGNTRRVPAYLVAGDRDQRLGELVEFRDYCRRVGMPVHLEVHEGLGHDYPADFDAVVARALAWIETP